MNATILPARRVTTRVAAFGVLERIGRAAVGRALQGLAFGRVEVIDASGRMVGGGGHGPGASVHMPSPSKVVSRLPSTFTRSTAMSS